MKRMITAIVFTLFIGSCLGFPIQWDLLKPVHNRFDFDLPAYMDPDCVGLSFNVFLCD